MEVILKKNGHQLMMWVNILMGERVSLEEYLDTESKYVQALNCILDDIDLDIKYLYVMELEKEDDIMNDDYGVEGFTSGMIETIKFVEEGQQLNRDTISFIIKAVLREILWYGLYSRKTHIIIKPGYNFYVNIISQTLSQDVIKKINSLGLYIEE